MKSADQLPLFEPEGEHALALMQAHAKRFGQCLVDGYVDVAVSFV